MKAVWRAPALRTPSGHEGIRLRASEPERLLNYLHLLGVRAEIDADRSVAVMLDGYGFGLNDLLHSWALANDVEVVVGQAAPAPTMAPMLMPFAPPRLGDMLMRKGLITQGQLDQALAESRATGDRLGEVLLKRQWLFEDELARTLAGQLDLPYVNLTATGVDRGVARMLPAPLGIRFAAIPIGMRGGSVRVAFADPTDDEAQQAVAAYLAATDAVVADLSDIRYAWRQIESGAGS